MKTNLQKLLIALVASTSMASLAAIRTWDGSSSGNWATAANWSGGVAPVAGDDLVFPAGVTRLLTTNNFSPNLAFNSITLLGSNYFLHGSALVLTNGIRMGTPGGNNANPTLNTIVADVQLNASQAFVVTNTFAKLVVQGDVSLGSRTLTLDGSGSQDIFGVISGVGGAVSKDGFGIVNFENNNSFSGGCVIWDGRIRAKEPLSLGTTAGGTTVHSSGMLELQANVTNEVLTLSGGDLFNNLSPGRWVGPINVVSNSSLSAAGDFFIEGAVTGAGNLSVDAAISGLRAEVNLVGSQNNTYSGTLQLLDGTLVLGKTLGNALSGPLVIGTGGSFNPTNAVVLNSDANQLLSSIVTVLQDGTFDLNGFSDAILGLRMIGGVVTNTGSGSLLVAGNIFATSVSGGPARIRSQIMLGGAANTFFVTNGPSANDLEIDRRVSGSFNWSKDEAGTMSLLASNSITGIVHVLAGTLELDDDAALGTLGGDRVVVHDGATLSLLSGANNIPQNLALNGDGVGGGGALLSFGTVAWNGQVTLVTDTTINVASGALTLTNVIDGPGGFDKTGAGTLRIGGTVGNTYAGNTWVRRGVLALNKTSGFAIDNAAQLIIGDASDGESTDTVRFENNFDLRTTTTIVVNRTGVLDLNDFTDDVGSIQMTGGTIQTGLGLLQLRGNVTAVADTTPGSPLPTVDPCYITGNLDLGTSVRTFTVNNDFLLSGIPTDLIVDANITGTSGGISKAGLGEMQLNGSNSFGGTLTVNSGLLIAANNHAFGSAAAGTDVAGAASLQLLGGITVTNESLNLNSSSATPGALVSSSGTNVWDGPVNLSANAVINVATNCQLNLADVISGTADLTKTGPGSLLYSGSSANTYTGTTTVNQGTLTLGKTIGNGSILGPLNIGDGSGGANADIVRLQSTSQIGGTVPITIASSGLFDLNGIGETFGSLAGTGNVTLGGAGLNAGGNGTSTLFSGVISETGSVTKSGAGTMTLAGANTFTGTTTVSAGALLVNGSQPQSPVVVAANGILGGSGTVGAITHTAGGSVSPGSSPGILTCSNATFSTASSDFKIELNGAVAGSGYDQLKVRGTASLGGSTLNVSVGPGFTPAMGQTFTILDNDLSDAVTGTFAGLPENATFMAGAVHLRISYLGGTGNDVSLTVIPPPQLSIVPAGAGQVTISWAPTTPGFVLQENLNLTTTNWINSPSGSANPVTLPVVPPQKFYRLIKP